MEGYDFLTAHFTNNERTVVEVYWIREDEDGKPETVVEYVEASIDKDGRPNEADQSWNNLLEHIDIDTLHDNTARHMADQELEFERMVMDIARKKGLFDNVDIMNDNIHKHLVDFVFAPFDPVEQKEQLFMIKLQLFELPQIKASKNREAKTKLRKAENIMTAIQAAIEIVVEE